MIFNSLGSNYSWSFALRLAFARRRDDDDLRRFLSARYGGRVWLYNRGRAALCEAVRLSGAQYVASNSFSCYAVEQAIQTAGAQAVLLDINSETLHFDLEQLKQAHQENPKLGAVIVQNPFGRAGTIKPLAAYCQRHKLVLIEDLAHCPANRYPDGELFGHVGDLVVFSFGRDKQIDVVNGGALIVRNQKFFKKVETPKPFSKNYHARFTTRFYPLLTVSLRFFYGLQIYLGRLVHQLLKRSQLLQSANDGPFSRASSLPNYRSRFVLEQFKNLPDDTARRQSLIKIYNEYIAEDRAADGSPSLLRYPLLLSSVVVKDLMLNKLQRSSLALGDHWYDSPVYPKRLQSSSVYRQGSCPVMESLAARVVNLPLHRQITPQVARRLGQTSGFYSQISFKTDFSAQSWHKAWQEFDAVNSNFLSSWQEGEAYLKSGHQIWRLGVYQGHQLVALVLAVLIKARRGRFLKIPGGPLFKVRDRRVQEVTLARLKALARQNKCAFVRLQPYLLDDTENRLFMADLKLRVSPVNLNAPHTLKIDLTQAANEILASQAFKNTRNYINKAQKSGLQIRTDNSQKALADFLKLLEYTQKYQGFVANDKRFMQAQFQAYAEAGKIQLYQAFDADEKELLAGAMIVDQGSEAAYLYAASSEKGQRLRAPYLLQWQIILQAKERSLATYNFWGVAPPATSDKHRFSGLTRFKRNFCKNDYAYLPSYDAILNWKRYRPVHFWETYEAKKRHL